MIYDYIYYDYIMIFLKQYIFNNMNINFYLKHFISIYILI